MLGFLKANLLKSLTGHSLFQGRLSKGYFALLFIWSAFLWYLFGVRAWHCFPGPFLNTMPSKAFSLASESFHIIRKLWGLYLTNGSFRCQCLPPPVALTNSNLEDNHVLIPYRFRVLSEFFKAGHWTFIWGNGSSTMWMSVEMQNFWHWEENLFHPCSKGLQSFATVYFGLSLLRGTSKALRLDMHSRMTPIYHDKCREWITGSWDKSVSLRVWSGLGILC